MYKRFKH